MPELVVVYIPVFLGICSLEDHTSAVYMLTSHPVVMSWSCGDDVPGVMWAGWCSGAPL